MFEGQGRIQLKGHLMNVVEYRCGEMALEEHPRGQFTECRPVEGHMTGGISKRGSAFTFGFTSKKSSVDLCFSRHLNTLLQPLASGCVFPSLGCIIVTLFGGPKRYVVFLKQTPKSRILYYYVSQ